MSEAVKRIRAAAAEIQALAAELEKYAPAYVERAMKDSWGGLSAGGGDGRSSRYGMDGANNGAVPRYALGGKNDPAGDSARLLSRSLRDALRSVRVAHREAKALLVAPAGEEVKRSWTGGICANLTCQAWVPNTRTNRLKAGRCPACYQYRRIHGKDRPAPPPPEEATEPVVGNVGNAV